MQYNRLIYPLKVLSHNLPASRAARIRVSWFVLGVAFGIGCTHILPSSHTGITPIAAQIPSEPASQAALHTKPAEPDLSQDHAATGATVESEQEKESLVEAKIYPLDMEFRVQNGDTLGSLLTDAGVTREEAHHVVQAIRKVYDPRKLDIGQNISVRLTKDKPEAQAPVIASMIVPISLTSTIEVVREKDNDFRVKTLTAPIERKVARAGGIITNSLYETGIKSGLPANLLGELIKAYSYDVDFQRDIKDGNRVDVLFERMQTEDGIVTGHGNMMFAELELDDRTLKVYRYVDKGGNADYYNEKGESIRKALLRTPINGARISSGFGLRSHPILGYSKMHRGVDFAAASGTPIYAAGDGKVEFAGIKGGYGNYLKIKHNARYASAYGHVSRFAAGVTSGQKVKQGQVVAYVGSTGMSTGPHLHYEIMVNNEQVNPSGVRFKTGTVLAGKELVAFRKNISKLEAQLDALKNGKSIAMADLTHDGV